MKVELVGRVIDVYEAEQANWITFSDTVQGGQIKLGIPKTVKILMDGLYNLVMDVKPGRNDKGLFLQVKSIQSQTKGG